MKYQIAENNDYRKIRKICNMTSKRKSGHNTVKINFIIYLS